MTAEQATEIVRACAELDRYLGKVDGFHASALQDAGYLEQAVCLPQTITVLDKGAPGFDRSFCTTHTYFGNGIEPNDWPCDPATRNTPGSSEATEATQ